MNSRGDRKASTLQSEDSSQRKPVLLCDLERPNPNVRTDAARTWLLRTATQPRARRLPTPRCARDEMHQRCECLSLPVCRPVTHFILLENERLERPRCGRRALSRGRSGRTLLVHLEPWGLGCVPLAPCSVTTCEMGWPQCAPHGITERRSV